MPGAESTGKADRGTHQRRGAQGFGHPGHARTDGAGDALLLGYELRRNCGRPGRSPTVCRGRAPAGTARIAASVGREQRPRRGRNPMTEPDTNRDKNPNETHVDEMTLLLYAERQLDREASGVSREGEAQHAMDLGRGLWSGGSGRLRLVYGIYPALGTPV